MRRIPLLLPGASCPPAHAANLTADTELNCSYWATDGECEANGAWMRKACAASCALRRACEEEAWGEACAAGLECALRADEAAAEECVGVAARGGCRAAAWRGARRTVDCRLSCSLLDPPSVERHVARRLLEAEHHFHRSSTARGGADDKRTSWHARTLTTSLPCLPLPSVPLQPSLQTSCIVERMLVLMAHDSSLDNTRELTSRHASLDEARLSVGSPTPSSVDEAFPTLHPASPLLLPRSIAANRAAWSQVLQPVVRAVCAGHPATLVVLGCEHSNRQEVLEADGGLLQYAVAQLLAAMALAHASPPPLALTWQAWHEGGPVDALSSGSFLKKPPSRHLRPIMIRGASGVRCAAQQAAKTVQSLDGAARETQLLCLRVGSRGAVPSRGCLRVLLPPSACGRALSVPPSYATPPSFEEEVAATMRTSHAQLLVYALSADEGCVRDAGDAALSEASPLASSATDVRSSPASPSAFLCATSSPSQHLSCSPTPFASHPFSPSPSPPPSCFRSPSPTSSVAASPSPSLSPSASSPALSDRLFPLEGSREAALRSVLEAAEAGGARSSPAKEALIAELRAAHARLARWREYENGVQQQLAGLQLEAAALQLRRRSDQRKSWEKAAPAEKTSIAPCTRPTAKAERGESPAAEFTATAVDAAVAARTEEECSATAALRAEHRSLLLRLRALEITKKARAIAAQRLREEMVEQLASAASELRGVEQVNQQLEGRLKAHSLARREQQARVASLRNQLQQLTAEMSFSSSPFSVELY
ncbi:hypothetical protein AB1Y20_004576 [Prymnesium parvum]|uniref:ShKT domain-containing protein n=1 Tax=Prymnesium parvum TaxID=97485 RepID=A0AB34J0Q4_PRYPA